MGGGERGSRDALEIYWNRVVAGGDQVARVEIGSAEDVGEAGERTRTTIEAFDVRPVGARSCVYPFHPPVLAAVEDLQPLQRDVTAHAVDLFEQVRKMDIESEPARLVRETRSGTESDGAYRSAVAMRVGQVRGHCRDFQWVFLDVEGGAEDVLVAIHAPYKICRGGNPLPATRGQQSGEHGISQQPSRQAFAAHVTDEIAVEPASALQGVALVERAAPGMESAKGVELDIERPGCRSTQFDEEAACEIDERRGREPVGARAEACQQALSGHRYQLPQQILERLWVMRVEDFRASDGPVERCVGSGRCGCRIEKADPVRQAIGFLQAYGSEQPERGLYVESVPAQALLEARGVAVRNAVAPLAQACPGGSGRLAGTAGNDASAKALR